MTRKRAQETQELRRSNASGPHEDSRSKRLRTRQAQLNKELELEQGSCGPDLLGREPWEMEDEGDEEV